MPCSMHPPLKPSLPSWGTSGHHAHGAEAPSGRPQRGPADLAEPPGLASDALLHHRLPGRDYGHTGLGAGPWGALLGGPPEAPGPGQLLGGQGQDLEERRRGAAATVLGKDDSFQIQGEVDHGGPSSPRGDVLGAPRQVRSDPAGALGFVGGRWVLPAEELRPRSLLPKPTQSHHPRLVGKRKRAPTQGKCHRPRHLQSPPVPADRTLPRGTRTPAPPRLSIFCVSQTICCLSFGVWLTSLSIMSEFSSCLRPSHAPPCEHTPFCLS